jgi:hypothetical protein
MGGCQAREWSLQEPIPDRLDVELSIDDFPCAIFARCKGIINDENVLSATTSTKSAGLMIALVQQHQSDKLFAAEAIAITWWQSRLDLDPHGCWRQYREASDFSLDVASPHAKVST